MHVKLGRIPCEAYPKNLWSCADRNSLDSQYRLRHITLYTEQLRSLVVETEGAQPKATNLSRTAAIRETAG
jgi:hypothetical protein